MVAYSFQKQFTKPLLSGMKRQTLRNERKRHARVGEELQLYTGMRKAYCRLVGRATCLSAEPIRLDFKDWRVEFGSGTAVTDNEGLEAFAALDGFGSWRALVEFWREHNPDVRGHWTGVRIYWGETLRPATAEAASQ